jgi:hypothetical protein
MRGFYGPDRKVPLDAASGREPAAIRWVPVMRGREAASRDAASLSWRDRGIAEIFVAGFNEESTASVVRPARASRDGARRKCGYCSGWNALYRRMER